MVLGNMVLQSSFSFKQLEHVWMDGWARVSGLPLKFILFSESIPK
jgi:hypothetical protein